MQFKRELTVAKIHDELEVWKQAGKEVDRTGLTVDNMFGKQRFGQYICNKYLNEGESCAEVFYCVDHNTAVSLLTNLVCEVNG